MGANRNWTPALTCLTWLATGSLWAQSQPPPAPMLRFQDGAAAPLAMALNGEQAEVARRWLESSFGPRFRAAPPQGDTLEWMVGLADNQRLLLRFTAGRRELEIRGPVGPAVAMRRLIRILNQPVPPGDSLRLLALPPNRVAGVSRMLAPAHLQTSSMMRAQAETAQRALGVVDPESRLPPVEPASFVAQEGAVEPSRPQDPPANNGDGGSSIQKLGELKGVRIELLDELDAMILQGRMKDIDELANLLRQLEELSRNTQPEILVQPLRHVSSESLQTIIEQVRDDLTGGRQGRVSSTSLVQPNAILLVGWGDALSSIRELIGKLDQPAGPQTRFETYRLRHAPAAQLQQTLLNAFPAAAAGLAPRVLAIGDTRTNTLIVRASPRDLVDVRRMIQQLDAAHGGAVNRAEVIPLRHTLAADVAQSITQLLSAPGSGRNAVLEIVAPDGALQEKLRSASLADVRVSPNIGANSLLVSAPPESMAVLRELIRRLDSPGASAQIKIFRVEHGDAGAMIQTLSSLLATQAGAGPRLPSTASDEDSLAPLRFALDARSNSIIAIGSEGDLTIVEALVLRLDETNGVERKNEVYRLKNSPANDVAIAVNQFLSSERRLQGQTPGAASPFERIEREVVVVPEPIGNRLIVSATPRYFDEIRDLIERLDEAPPQVVIQVLIAEVELNNTRELGVELGLQDSVLFDRSLLGDLLTTVNTVTQSTPSGIVTTTQEVIQAATNQPGFDFNNRPLGNSGSARSLGSSGRVGSQGLSSFAVGRENDTLGFGGLVLSASSENVSVLLRALQESRRVQILSRPHIRTLDNQPAFIQVGQRVPRIVGSTLSQVGQSNSVILEDVGLILGVTPRVSPDDVVVMEINAEKSSLGPEQDGVPVSVSVDGTVIRSPVIETTTAEATVSAASGETIVLGGLITKDFESLHRQVPWLGNLPVLGNLFQFNSRSGRRTELLLILTPQVVRSPADSERLKQIEFARMSWCARDVVELHGDIGATPLVMDPMEGEATEIIYPDQTPRGAADRQAPVGPAEPYLIPQTGLPDASAFPVRQAAPQAAVDSGAAPASYPAAVPWPGKPLGPPTGVAPLRRIREAPATYPPPPPPPYSATR